MSSAASRTGTWPANEPVLVYRDHADLADPKERLNRLREELADIAEMASGIDRHARLVGALIEAGQLLQGVADAALPGEEPLNDFLHRLARCVVRSWDTGFAEVGELPLVPPLPVAGLVELRLPEGFAFYSVYPEAYVEAARKLNLSGPARVIGIRSIGTTLGAIVAAALDAPAATTVRPFGDPFARRIELADDLLDSEAHYVIVDEGPGLSGSSFGAIGDWLEERGVPLERIAFIPSHTDDPGPQASKTHLHRWQRAQRVPADFGGRLPKLARTWAAGFLEPHDQLKFAGLGATGERKLELARTLHGAGLTPQPVGLVHGFLIERPPEKAGPLEPDEKPVPEIARYIVERANLFPAGEHGGASIAQLLVMCRRNISLALGEAALSAIGCLDADRLSSGVVRVRTDNRMDRTNWLRTPDGRLIKADAIDHHQAHDLIGCQDAAWDVAGAIAEFELSDRGAEALIQLIEQNGRGIDPELLAFYRIAYAAFRLGQATLAKDPHAERYVSVLHDLLHQYVCGAIPQESSVG